MAGRFERSHSTDRALAAEVRPSLRGLSHRVAAIMAVPAAAWVVANAPSVRSAVAVGVFGVCIAVMFTVSATVHARRWSATTTEVLFRLDKTGIYLAIAGTATPIAVLALEGWHRPAMLGGAWGAAAVGIVIEWLPFPTPRGVAHTLYLAMGWATVPFLPAVVSNAGWGTAGLLLAGGAAYTVGAVIVAIQRPDPAPSVFGYHEVWHLLVVVAVVLHYVMIGVTLLPPPTVGAA